jgi:hypothetical protein
MVNHWNNSIHILTSFRLHCKDVKIKIYKTKFQQFLASHHSTNAPYPSSIRGWCNRPYLRLRDHLFLQLTVLDDEHARMRDNDYGCDLLLLQLVQIFRTEDCYYKYCQEIVDRESSVSIAISYGLDGRGSIPGRDKNFLSTLHSVQTSSGAHLASYTMVTWGPFPWLK